MLNDGTLQIAEARASDVGSYACHVTSAGGDDSRVANLYVIELPYPPSSVAATRIGQGKMVNVSWIPGFDGNSELSKFIIQKRVVPVTGPIPDTVNSWTTEVANVSSDARWIALPTLKAAAAYQFRVSAVNSVGEGQPSEPSNRVTLPQEGKKKSKQLNSKDTMAQVADFYCCSVLHFSAFGSSGRSSRFGPFRFTDNDPVAATRGGTS